MSMQSILSASMSLAQMKAGYSAQTQNQGQMNVLKAEIKQDGGNSQKEEKLKALEEKNTKLTETMSKLQEIQNSTKPSEEEEDTSITDTEKQPNTDRVDLSKPNEEGDGEKAASVQGKAVHYNAQGKTEAAASSEKKMDVKA